MGTFDIRIRLPTGEEMDALVDTGSTFTKMPRSLLEGLGVRPIFESEVELGNGEVIFRPVGYLEIEVQGRRAPVPVAFGGDAERALLGATALETLGFSADPRNRRLVPTRSLEVLHRSRGASAARSPA